MKLLIFAFILATPALAQLPDAPKPSLDRATWTILAADASARAFDVYSTHRMLAQGDRELFLPKFVSGHAPAMAAYSAGAVAVDYFAARALIRSRHPKLAKIVVSVDAAQDGFWAVHNMFLKPGKR